MGFVDRVRSLVRSDPTISLGQYANYLNPDFTSLNFGGMTYPMFGLNQSMSGSKEEMESTFIGLVDRAYKANGVIFACMMVRQALFMQATFQWRQWHNGHPGDLFSTADLQILRRPWVGGTTGDLLTRIIQHVDLGGNAFVTRRAANRLVAMRPDWCTLIVGSQEDPDVQLGDIDAEILGLVYHPGGPQSNRRPVPLLREDFAHIAPTPDPQAMFRGMSWLMPIMRELMADSAATSHKLRFFENAATPNMVVTVDATLRKEAFEEWVALFSKRHDGLMNAYKTMYLGAGAQAHVVGNSLQQMDFSKTQGAGESRIAAAAGVPPTIVGFSEGLQGSSLNAGNFGMAMRRFVDVTITPLWQNTAGSLEVIVPPPNSAAELWFDTRGIPALRVDNKDAADIQFVKAQSIRHLIDGGYKADSVVKAIEAEDMTLLEHTGLFSVQLQAPGSTKMPVGEVPGETPVGPTGTKPETIPPTDPSTKPLTDGATKTPVVPVAAKAGRALERLITERTDDGR